MRQLLAMNAKHMTRPLLFDRQQLLGKCFSQEPDAELSTQHAET
jgi:hypothetical protein